MSVDVPIVDPGTTPDAPSEPRPRRRGRTTLLIATAAVLGLVAGTCTGFLIQAHREPTRLPSLSQPVLTQAKGPGPEPLSAAQDHRVKTDGDLRKLLIARPKGTKAPDWAPETDGWLDMAGYADDLKNADREYKELAGQQFRRAVGVTWSETSTRNVMVRLVQYRQEEDLTAHGRAHAWDVRNTRSWPVFSGSDGMAYLFKPEYKAGYLPLYRAGATAARGDIAMEIWIYDSKPIPKSKIMDLAKRQLERL